MCVVFMKVFLSHSFDDEKLAYELRTNLMEHGIIDGYLVEDHFDPTKPPVVKIKKEISDSDYLIAVITEKAKKSASVGFEIGYANAKHIPIVMLLEEKVEPPVTVIKEGIVFTRNNFEEHCKRVRTFLYEEIGVKVKELQNGKVLRLVKGDITKSRVDVIVNSANSYLKHGGGVARAIVKNGGYVIQKESNKIAPVPVGSATITTSGRLLCKAVIHAVGPQMGEGDRTIN